MPEPVAAVSLTVFFDGQFYVGIASRRDRAKTRYARTVFGAEPTNADIEEFILYRWDSLSFSPAVQEVPKALPANPKRRQRETAKLLSGPRGVSKSNQALGAMRELRQEERRHERHSLKEEAQREAYEKRSAKRKRKRRGH